MTHPSPPAPRPSPGPLGAARSGAGSHNARGWKHPSRADFLDGIFLCFLMVFYGLFDGLLMFLMFFNVFV